MRLLSHSAHGSAVALTIDVAENSGRQETKLPAVPPHYDIITEGWPAAAADPITGGGGLWHVQRSVRSRGGATHTHTHINTLLPAYLGNLFSIKKKQRFKLIPSSSSYEVFSTVFRKNVLACTRVV